MQFTAQLDVDVVALEAEDEVTCLVSLTAPVPESIADRPGETLIAVVDRSGVARGGVKPPTFRFSVGSTHASLSVAAHRPNVGNAPPESESPLRPRAMGFRSSSGRQAACASSMRWRGICALGGTPSTASDPLGIGPRCDERLEQCDAQHRCSRKARRARLHCPQR